MRGSDRCAHPQGNPARRGRIRFWVEVALAGEDAPRVLRVVTLEDGKTVHNAFFDRNFGKEP